MFSIKVVSSKETKTMTLDEETLTKHVKSFIVFQAKKLGQTTTVVINNGESYTWHIKYLPN